MGGMGELGARGRQEARVLPESIQVMRELLGRWSLGGCERG